ncbi:protein commissureless 2 [Harmonia axyridis]|uniref:protein commissureless 2 n=1 Tax=Harmonia axyridis TaxID=115357 RepID=UPI001E27880A|nr:protein commissureless 2 [Harmonia axyridis]
MYKSLEDIMAEGFSFTVPSGVDLEKFGLDENISVIIAPGSKLSTVRENEEYEQFLADVWIGIMLTLMVVICVCCMCSCLLYHKFQQWKRRLRPSRTPSSVEEGGSPGYTDTDLPSYDMASGGLPSYDEAIKQSQRVKELAAGQRTANRTPPTEPEWVPRTPPTPVHQPLTELLRHLTPSTNSSTASAIKTS